MKILMTCLSQSWGGMEMFVLTLVRQFLKRKDECSLVCYPGTKLYEEGKKLNIPVISIKASSYFHPIQIYKLASFLKKNKFDVVHSQYSKELWTLVPALKISKTKTPLIFTKQVGSFIVKKDFLHKKLYDRITIATAISTVIKKNLLETCPIDEARVEIVMNAVDTVKFDPAKVNREKIRNEFNLREDEIVLGMSARFTEGKGHEDFLRAAKELNRKFDNLKFLLVGEPSMGENTYGKKIKDLVVNLRLQNKIVFTGYRTDMPEVYSAMDIFAFPSHAEAFGLALTEAMAMERACVASNSDGILDIIEDNKNGLFFENKNYLSLKEKLEQLITSKGERDRLGKEARKTVLEKFELQRNISEFKEIYKRVSLNSSK